MLKNISLVKRLNGFVGGLVQHRNQISEKLLAKNVTHLMVD